MRLLVAGAATSAVVGLASVAMLFATAPEWLSLICEPFSLFLMPGLVAGVIQAGPHDLNRTTVLLAAIIFYLLLFYMVLEWRAFKGRRGVMDRRGRLDID